MNVIVNFAKKLNFAKKIKTRRGRGTYAKPPTLSIVFPQSFFFYRYDTVYDS